MAYWLMKSEPDTFGIDDLKSRPKQTEPWNGVRNFQARNFIKAMKPGDLALFYHSSCEVPGVAGIAEIVSDPYPDPTQFQRKSEYFDDKSKPEQPRWYLVDVKYQRHTKRVVPLSELREHAAKLAGFKLLTAGRLSVMPVTPDHWNYILQLEKKASP
jgi:predicted RNA-binding protein with PUA-like domain